jgi:hypothetical protein
MLCRRCGHIEAPAAHEDRHQTGNSIINSLWILAKSKWSWFGDLWLHGRSYSASVAVRRGSFGSDWNERLASAHDFKVLCEGEKYAGARVKARGATFEWTRQQHIAKRAFAFTTNLDCCPAQQHHITSHSRYM